jgi:hypothetical protein
MKIVRPLIIFKKFKHLRFWKKREFGEEKYVSSTKRDPTSITPHIQAFKI